MMAKAVLEILSKYDDSKITVASNILEQAKELAEMFPKCTEAAYVDIFNVRLLLVYFPFSTSNYAPLWLRTTMWFLTFLQPST